MNRLTTGYYLYHPHTGVSYLGCHEVNVSTLPSDTILTSTAIFHNGVITADNESLVAYFKEDCPLLHDIHFTTDITGLYNI